MVRRTARSLVVLAFSSVLLLAAASLAGGASEPPGGQAPKNRYLGVAKCKACHSKEETGNQFARFQAGPHAKAFEVLASPRAKEVAAERGIADPQKSDECVRCHVTGFGLPDDHFQKGFDRTAGVQCETCHGPGEQHMLARMRAAKDAGPGYPDIPEGEIVLRPPLSTCTTCHNEESPTFVPFCHHRRMALVRHLNPQKPRTAEELAALDACTCEDACVCKTGPDATCSKEAGG